MGLGVKMTQMSNLLDKPVPLKEVAEFLADILTKKLGYNDHRVEGEHPAAAP